MKKLAFFSLLVLFASCRQHKNPDFIVTVSNDQDFSRDELVEVPISAIGERIRLIDEEQYIVLDARGEQVPYQITYDDHLLFSVSIAAQDTATYTITVGEPVKAAPYVHGRHYLEYADDIAWENDRIGYRIYGDEEIGYDIWAKRVPHLVLEERYSKEHHPTTLDEIAQLRKARKYREADALRHAVSHHVDLGDGLDCYRVDATLGCGTSALMQGDKIIYPACWEGYEVLENGPLRFTIRLTYPTLVVGSDKEVAETRIISLARGEQLNKTIVTYTGLSKTTPVATGLVIHPSHPTAFVTERERGYIAYADLTENVANGNGVIYVGAVMTKKIKDTQLSAFTSKEAKERGALGHVLAISNYRPGSAYTYYWGAGWSKYGFDSMEAWSAYLEHCAQRIQHPLVVNY